MQNNSSVGVPILKHVVVCKFVHPDQCLHCISDDSSRIPFGLVKDENLESYSIGLGTFTLY